MFDSNAAAFVGLKVRLRLCLHVTCKSLCTYINKYVMFTQGTGEPGLQRLLGVISDSGLIFLRFYLGMMDYYKLFQLHSPQQVKLSFCYMYMLIHVFARSI